MEYVKIGELKPHPRNPNQHTAAQIQRLSELIQYQGWRLPIIVSKQSGYIISGHGRLEAAKLLGLDEVPISFQDFLDEDQEYAFLVSDNSIASWAELNLSQINSDLEILGPDFDINLLGIENFTLVAPEVELATEEQIAEEDERNKKYILEIQFPNEMEMKDVHDDLLSRGFIVKVK